MNLLTYTPAPPLSDFVELLWIAQGEPPPHARERILPTGTMELVIGLLDDGFGPLVCGAQSEYFVIGTAGQAAVMGVHFRPGGAFPFLNLPAGELHNEHVTLDTLWGRKAGTLHERLLEAKTPAARFCILEQALIQQATRPLARHPAVAYALTQFQGGLSAPAVAQVTERVGLSPRRFIAAFTDEVGLTPKLYCRIQRFQDVIRRVHKAQRVAWAAVALSCGYYDQAHFIRDFKAFSGLNPSDYLQVRSEHLNHVPLAD